MTLTAAEPRQPTAFAVWSRRLAVFGVQAVLVAAVLHRFSFLPTPLALATAGAGLLLALLALMIALVAIVIIWRTGRSGTWSAAAGLILSLALFSWPATVATVFWQLPRIADVSTDTTAPPAMVTLARQRGGMANSVVYPGAVNATAQREAYPDIQPLVLARPADEVFDLAGDAVRRLKWRIEAEEAPAGRGKPGYIEAVDRTLILGFPDDVVIRIDGDQRQTRIDVRSASRYGRFDFGRNAARIREFYQELHARLEAAVPAAGRRIRRRARPEAAVPKRPRGSPAQKQGPRTSQDRARPDARRAPQPKATRPARGEDQARDRRR